MDKKEGSSSTRVRRASVLAAGLFLACGLPVARAAGPNPFDLQSPGDGAIIHDYLPVLKWRDAGKDAVDHYEVWVNGRKVADAKTNSHKAGNTIRNGETPWRVVAVGKDGTKVPCRKEFTFRKQSILTTRWGEQVTPENVHPEYPRPQMVRERWRNLNGLWDYAIRPMAEADAPDAFDGKILVPFPIEAGLSGIMVTLGYTNVIWYRRTFEVPREWGRDRVLLNFEAVDWRSTVWVNGKQVGTHEGGYDPFSFDITDALKRAGAQELVVRVFDPTRSGTQPFGKQVMRNWAKKIHSLFTCSSGIWYTVWLEPVSRNHIKSLVMVPDIDRGALDVTAKCSSDRGTVELVAKDGDKIVAGGRGRPGEKITLSIKKPRLWSPITPFLYDLEATLTDGGSVDRVDSYFGMRKISLGKVGGISKIFLNNDELFMQEPLDQGFWPDGIHTAPSDEALRYDIELTKYFGYNATRKHIKTEPRRWYYWTDRLGLLVQQDAVSPGRDEFKKDKSPPQFEHDLVAMIENLYSNPSVYAWVIFNEGWGQHDTARYTELVSGLDPSRLTQQASGWHDKKGGDIVDSHNYKHNPKAPKAEPNRASMLGEYGARGLNVEGHRTWPSRMWSGMVDNYHKMTENYLHMLRCVESEKKAKNLSGAVYSVLTDEEGENCGLVTYDREVYKIDPDKVIQPSRDLWFIPSEF
ncbi:MAG: glycoside hydrolase family 2 protein, partial [Planctomycetota bacterium]